MKRFDFFTDLVRMFGKLGLKLGVPLLAFGLYPYYAGHLSMTKFNAAQWRTASLSSNNKRCLMANDLTKRYLKTGMARGRVETLLGSPKLEHDQRLYPMGRCGLMNYSVIVFYDANGRLSDYGLHLG